MDISPCFLCLPLLSSPPPPLPPFGGGATGRDSLESKVTFIQLREWVSPVECVPDKDFTAGSRFTLKPYTHKAIYSLCSGAQEVKTLPRCVCASGESRQQPRYAQGFSSLRPFLLLFLPFCLGAESTSNVSLICSAREIKEQLFTTYHQVFTLFKNESLISYQIKNTHTHTPARTLIIFASDFSRHKFTHTHN